MTKPTLEGRAWTPLPPPAPDCAVDCRQRAEADHRIANHLAQLSSYLRVAGAEFARSQPLASRDAVRLFVQSLDAQILSMARLHRLITARGQDSPVELATLLREVCDVFADGQDGRIAIAQELSGGHPMRPDQALLLSQFVTEAMTNALKHAYPDGGGGTLLVRCRDAESGGISIEIVDGGVGLPRDFDPERDGGFGSRLMRQIGRDLGARLSFDGAGRGLAVSLHLPPRSD